MKSLIGAMRVVLPPPGAFLTAGLLFAIFELPVVWLEWRFGAPLDLRVRPGAILWHILFFLYGVYRVVGFHPAYRPAYARWLAGTPWTRGRPLPLGPARLVWQDLVALGAGMALASFQPGLDVIALVPRFLAAYLALVGVSFFWTEARPYGYAVMFGLGLIVRLWQSPGLCAWTSVLLYLVADAGLHHALGKFPWRPESKQAAERLASAFASTAQHGLGYALNQPLAAAGIGWPYNRLSPAEPPHAVRLRHSDGVLISLLAGWWLYALSTLFGRAADQAAFALVAAVVGIAAGSAVRCAIYCAGHAPPISFWGRLCTRYTIIPGYDRVFAAPAAAFVAGFGVLYVLSVSQLPAKLASPMALAVALLVLLNAGPRLNDWRLTGHHRITPGLSASGARDYVKAS